LQVQSKRFHAYRSESQVLSHSILDAVYTFVDNKLENTEWAMKNGNNIDVIWQLDMGSQKENCSLV
jgi:hypothetical protein